MAKLGKKRTKGKKLDYFEAFEEQAKLAVKEADLLLEAVKSFKSAADLKGYLETAHAIEKEADSICHGVYDAILPDFVTPIDREDILELTASLDDITDTIEEVIQSFYIYDIHFMHDDARVFAELICKACSALSEALADFRNFKKSSDMHACLVDVNDVENQADELYMNVIRSLYVDDRENPLRVVVWTRIFELMEDCADKCESTADLMNCIKIKHG